MKAAFLKTGQAARDVYACSPIESNNRCNLWLLLAAAYGLVNANAKFPSQADNLISSIGLSKNTVVPQLFYLRRDSRLVLVVAKVAYDLIFAGENSNVEDFITKFTAKFKIGTVFRGPGILKFYGMTIEQHDDFSIIIHPADKLDANECYPSQRIRRRQFKSAFTEIEKASFMSVNSSLCWIGITASPFRTFYASYLQKMPSLTVDSMRTEANNVCLLRKLVTAVHYPSPSLLRSSEV